MMFPITITKDEVMERPLRSYEGKVVIAADEKSIANAMAEIVQSDIVGFDTEAKPTFKKGEIRNISLVQVATAEKVFLLRTQYTGISDALHKFLEDPNIIKVGIGLLDDYNLLDRLRPFKPDGFIDLNNTFNDLGAEKIGARNLAAMVLDIRISKSAQTSNWEAQTLSDKQVRYASTDAWICLEIYNKLLYWGYI
ncbi:3'-5' exonuclease [Roseivirga sp.]|uniref:3'-5' exonuclease n=1 Tax=Roseivirga sp. TaxID=1964215 RepID=UPI003B8B98CF